jgi:hypothetical protein
VLNLIYGWYVRENLKGYATSIVYEASLAAGDSGNLAIGDAVDGDVHAADLKTYDYIIHEAFAYANPGFVQLDILPDNSSSKKVRVNATNQPARITLTPPMLAEVDTIINYANEGQPNNLYICLSALKIPESSVPKLTFLAEGLAEMIPVADQLKEANFNLQNVIRALQGEATLGYEGGASARTTAHKEFCGFRGGC